jgi:hypothetical protein
MTEADSTPQDGLAGALLAIAREVPDGLLGEFQARDRLVDPVGLRKGAFAYPFVRNLIRAELLDACYYTRTHRFRVQPDCERIATLDQASATTMRCWRQQHAAEPRLCAALVAVCTRASIPNTDPSRYQGETWIVDSPEGVYAGQAGFKYPATSVPFSNDQHSPLRRA